MYDSGGMCAAEPLRHLHRDVEGLVDGQWASRQHPLERFSTVEGHGDEQAAIRRLAGLEDRTDVRVVEGGRGPGFGKEARGRSWLIREEGREHLDGNGALEPRVAGVIHHAHPTPADLSQHLVPIDPLRRELAYRRLIEERRAEPSGNTIERVLAALRLEQRPDFSADSRIGALLAEEP